jgi:hypothetical protein
MNQIILIFLFTGCVIPNLGELRVQQNARMCTDPGYAYEAGYNRGLARGRLDTTWVDASCAPEARAQVRQAYQNGFDRGVSNAPTVLHVSGAAQGCRFSSDCGDGRSCRADASGTNVCMGNGIAGDACWFSSDCTSGSCNVSARVCR